MYFGNRSDIYISETSYTFETTPVGKSTMLKIPIKNKGKSAHTVSISNDTVYRTLPHKYTKTISIRAGPDNPILE